MKTSGEQTRETVSFIEQKLRQLNAVVLLSIVVALLIVVRFVYDAFGYIPNESILVFLVAMSLLSCGIYMIAKHTTTKAVAALNGYSDKMKALLETSHAIHAIPYSDVLFEQIIQTAMDMTGADGGSLIMHKEDDLVFTLVHGMHAEELQGLSFPAHEGIAGWVVNNRESVIVPDTLADSRHLKCVDASCDYHTRSLLCVPLIEGETVTGVIELVSDRPNQFTQEDERMLKHFLDQAAISLRDVHYHERMKNYEIHISAILMDAIESLSGKKGHSMRVARYALVLGHALMLDDQELRRLYRAALLHDIGFLRMDLENINSAEQYNAHASIGYQMLSPISFYEDIAEAVLCHHERFDGSGPLEIQGTRIPLLSRIISIAEVFDAMTSGNSLKKTLGKAGIMPLEMHDFHGAVLRMKIQAGSAFDPELIELFVTGISEDHMDPRITVPFEVHAV